MNKIALFIILPFVSHYNSSFGLADTLKSKGCRVVFTGSNNFRYHIQKEGFEFVDVPLVEEYVVNNIMTGLKLLFVNLVSKKLLKVRYRNFLKSVYAIQEICKEIKPQEIFIDEHLSLYFFVLKNKSTKITIINTKLPTRHKLGIPPLTCSIPFKNNLFYWLLSEFFWLRHLVSSKFNFVFRDVVFLGADDKLFFKRFSKKNGVPFDEFYNRYNLLYEGVRKVDTIHILPRFLEYNWYKCDQFEEFTYYYHIRKNEENLNLLTIVHSIKLLPNSNAYLVYVSLGTLSGLYEKTVKRFYQRLFLAIEEMKSVYLIVSTGGVAMNGDFYNKSRIFVFESVPQQVLLPYCDLMISHGGMNSVCECIEAAVPVLIYPLNCNNSDQPGNAARIVSKGFGLQGNIYKDTSSHIKKKINKMLSSPSFRKRILEVNK